MNEKKIDLLWLWISIISYLLMSATFLLMPLDNMIPALREGVLTLVVGICFWFFLILGIVSQIILARRRKAWYVGRRLSAKQSAARRIGLIGFGANTVAVFADLAMVLSIGGLFTSVMLTNATGYICYLFLSTLSFSFCMHCILNGRVYYHITHHYSEKSKSKRDSEKEREKAEGAQ